MLECVVRPKTLRMEDMPITSQQKLFTQSRKIVSLKENGSEMGIAHLLRLLGCFLIIKLLLAPGTGIGIGIGGGGGEGRAGGRALRSRRLCIGRGGRR